MQTIDDLPDDILLPQQLVRDHTMSPEQELAWSIVERAFLDLAPSTNTSNVTVRREADENREEAYQFLLNGCVIADHMDLCEILDLDRTTIANRARLAYARPARRKTHKRAR